MKKSPKITNTCELARSIKETITEIYPDLAKTGQVFITGISGLTSGPTQTVGVQVLGSLHVRGSQHYYTGEETAEKVRERLTYNLHDWKNGS